MVIFSEPAVAVKAVCTVLTSREYLIVYGNYSKSFHSMGQSCSLTPGGGSVYQQFGGGSVGNVVDDAVGVVVCVTRNSTCHKVHLNIAISHSEVISISHQN